MTTKEHKKRHVELHKAFDELVADWVSTTKRLDFFEPLLAGRYKQQGIEIMNIISVSWSRSSDRSRTWSRSSDSSRTWSRYSSGSWSSSSVLSNSFSKYKAYSVSGSVRISR